MVAPTFDMLQLSSLAKFFELCEAFVINHNKALLTTQLVNGTTIFWRSADRPNRLRGPNLGWWWLDEGAYASEEVYKILIGRLRKQPARGWITTTPKGFDWIYRLFTSGDSNFHLTHASTATNPFLPPDYITDLRSQYTSAFAEQEIEGRFVDLGNARIRREWFRYGLPVKPLPVQLGVDLAISTKQTADYTAIVASAFDPEDGMRYVLDVQRDRKTFHGAQMFIQQMAAKWNPTVINVESVAYQQAMVQELLRTTSLNVKGIVSNRDKAVRFAPVEARMEQGLVTFAPGLPGYFEDELLSWPTGPHDDCIDGCQLSMNIPTRRAVRVL